MEESTIFDTMITKDEDEVGGKNINFLYNGVEYSLDSITIDDHTEIVFLELVEKDDELDISASQFYSLFEPFKHYTFLYKFCLPNFTHIVEEVEAFYDNDGKFTIYPAMEERVNEQ